MKLSAAALRAGPSSWESAPIPNNRYPGPVSSTVLIDLELQCIQLSNQAPLFGLCPAASNRINTIFMSTYFAGGTLGTFLSGAAWAHFGWPGRRGCRSAALRRLAVTHAPQRKIAPHKAARYGTLPDPAVHPESVTTGRRRFRIPRPQAAPLSPLRPDDILSPATTAACPRLRPGMPPEVPKDRKRSSCLREADTLRFVP